MDTICWRICIGDLDGRLAKTLKEGIERVIFTSVGEGPMPTEESLIDEKGEPVRR